MRAITHVLYACLILLPACQLDRPRENNNSVLFIQRSASFPDIELVSDRIKKDCNVSERLSDDIEYYALKRFAKIERFESVSAKTPGKALFVRITHLSASGGGQWAGDRHINIEGVLWDRGTEIGSFVARRESLSGNDPCMSLARITRALGEDIGHWLVSPTLNARLGDMK